ncbi:hypothetical protein [Runella sp.]|uniref:hypothetical protein n=1 Tax=Runella sp. TaxID=1960881 RepID=UPI003D0ED78F
MKSIAYFFFMMVLWSGCRSKDDISPKTAPIDEVFGLKYQDKTTLKAEGDKFNLELSDIEDGRCIGKNIVCIWAGDISVNLLLDNTQSVKLRLNGLTLDKLTSLPASTPIESNYLKEVRIKLNNEPYIIRLESVDVKNLNEEQASLTPKENYTVWLKILKSTN